MAHDYRPAPPSVARHAAAYHAAPGRPRRARVYPLVIIVAVLAIVVVAVGGFEYLYRDRIYPQVQVRAANLSVGGQTLGTAAVSLHPFSLHQRFRAIALLAPGHVLVLVPAHRLGYLLDGRLTAWRAYTVGHQGSLLQRLGEQIRALVSGAAVPVVQRVDQRALRDYLFWLASALNRRPGPGIPGRQLDMASAQRRIAQLLLGVQAFHVQLPFIPIPALPVPHIGRHQHTHYHIRAPLPTPPRLTAWGHGHTHYHIRMPHNKHPRHRVFGGGWKGRVITGVGRKHPSPVNVYAATMPGKLRQSMVGLPERVYVPDSGDGTIAVINPATFQVVARFAVGQIPHHVAPAWDLSRLYVDNEGSSSLTVIDPRTGMPVGTIPVPYPYNLYFTPDGRKAIVVVERLGRLDFRDPHTWRLLKSVPILWPGVDHLDFSANGRYLLASTEYSGIVVKVDTVAMKVAGWVNVGGLPVDVRLAPDGSVFYVANQGRDGVSIIDPLAMKEVGFLPTGFGAHGLAVSRDTKSLYVSNRLAGTISVITFRTRRVSATWQVGGSPDMLQLSPAGRQLWVSNRFGGTVAVVDTRTGRVLHTIPVGLSPHGLCYFPNVGRFSLGHNGIFR